jgi:hypothetical protein
MVSIGILILGIERVYLAFQLLLNKKVYLISVNKVNEKKGEKK